MARRAVAEELSRSRILDEARDLFSLHGYHALTMRGIAKAMGYSHGALYYHFKEKAELFFALVNDDFEKLLLLQRDVIAKTKLGEVAQLEKLMMGFIRFGLKNPNHYEIMFMIKDPELQRYSRTLQAECLDLFASVVRAIIKRLPDGENKMYTLPWNLFMAMHGFIAYNIQYKQTYEEVKRLAAEHVKYLCQPLNPQSSSEQG